MEAGPRIREARERLKISQAELGRRIGQLRNSRAVSQTTINKIESGATKRSQYFPELSRLLEIPLNELDLGYSEIGLVLPEESLVGRRDLPIYGSAEGGEGILLVDYDPVEHVKRPYVLENVRGGYGILITGESMIPIIRPGDIVLVHPHLPPRTDDIAVFFRNFRGDTTAMVKEYRSQTDKAWKVRRYQPKQEDFSLPRSEWQQCHVSVGKYSRR